MRVYIATSLESISKHSASLQPHNIILICLSSISLLFRHISLLKPSCKVGVKLDYYSYFRLQNNSTYLLFLKCLFLENKSKMPLKFPTDSRHTLSHYQVMNLLDCFSQAQFHLQLIFKLKCSSYFPNLTIVSPDMVSWSWFQTTYRVPDWGLNILANRETWTLH